MSNTVVLLVLSLTRHLSSKVGYIRWLTLLEFRVRSVPHSITVIPVVARTFIQTIKSFKNHESTSEGDQQKKERNHQAESVNYFVQNNILRGFKLCVKI